MVPPTARPGFPRVRNQRQGLERALEPLEWRLIALGSGEDRDPQTAQEAVEMLAALGETLTSHFGAEEEPGGLFGELQSVAPRARGDMSALVEEHQRFRERVAKLLARARRAPRHPEEWVIVMRGFRRFARDLRAHERAENGLVAEILLEDQGGG